MDPLSISAATAGLVSLADLVFRTTTRYVRQVKESSKEVQTVLSELNNFSILLHNLSLVAYDLENATSANNTQSHEPNLKVKLVFDCQQILDRIRTGLEKAEQDFVSTAGIKRVQAHLRWPFSGSETKELVQTVSADTFDKLRICISTQDKIGSQLDDVQSTVRKILDIETKTTLGRTTQEILDFFARKIDNRSVFDMYKSRSHPLTCLWFTQSQVFQEWQRAGKSVISSVIIAECLQLTGSNHGVGSCQTAVAYFFCSYRDAATQDLLNILCSLTLQVARQDTRAFQILCEYYEDLRSQSHAPGNPSTKLLADILTRMSSLFGQLYIIVDGLDECGDDACLVVEALSCLAQDSNCITMALLSRNELYIREILEETFEHMEVEAHTEDIELYVAVELEQRITSRELRLRDVSLKDEIILQLVRGARGM
ncbi:hypothetical protein F5Y09DRAFT_331436 [Xylaria sp. FL1042]|nr:hypothetical protein F5Y09DRAFT_331436 [Xylaria sp. FL1042]